MTVLCSYTVFALSVFVPLRICLTCQPSAFSVSWVANGKFDQDSSWIRHMLKCFGREAFFLRKFKIIEMVWNVGRLRFLVSSNQCLHPVSEVKLSICKLYTDVVVLSEILWVQCRWLRAVAVSLKCENAKPLKRAPCFCPPSPTWLLMEILHVAPEKRKELGATGSKKIVVSTLSQ